MPIIPSKRTKSPLSIHHNRSSRSLRQASGSTAVAEEARRQEPALPRTPSPLSTDSDISDSGLSTSSNCYSNKRRRSQRSPRTSEYRKIPTGKQAEKYRAILNDLTERRLKLHELLSLVCVRHNDLHFSRKFQDLKRFVLEEFLLNDGLVSDSEIEIFLQRRGYSVAQDKFKNELRQVSLLTEYRTFDNPVDDFQSPSSILPWEHTFERAPTVIGLFQDLCHPPRNVDATCSEQRLLFLLAFIVRLQNPQKCENFAVSLGCFLRSNGLTRKGVEVMSRLGICASYHRVLKAEEQQVQNRRMQIRGYGTNPSVNITYDNLEFMQKVNDVRLGDQPRLISATTAMANEGIEMPEHGLLQSDFRPNEALHSSEVFQAGPGHDSWKPVSSFS